MPKTEHCCLPITGDDKDNGNITSTIPDIDLVNEFKDTDSHVLIFDDLERCVIPPLTVLGYINQFVEVRGLKVILIANDEKEILRREDAGDGNKNEARYLTIKEKLVGKSFDLTIDVENALEHFLDQLQNRTDGKLLHEKKDLILFIFQLADYGNLRHLKQAVFDFERFHGFLPSFALEKNDFVERTIELFFVISFELKKGNIYEEDIKKLFLIDFLAQRKDEDPTPEQIIRRKYRVFSNYQPFDYAFLESFFAVGILDKDQLSRSIRNSMYFVEENTPAWMKLHRIYDLNDDEFEVLFQSVNEKFQGHLVEDKYEVLQIAGLFLALSQSHLIPLQKGDILSTAMKCIDILKEKGLMSLRQHEELSGIESHGYRIYATETPEFQALITYARAQAMASQDNDLRIKALELINLMVTDLDDFREQVIISNSRHNLYFNTPIFAMIPVQEFMKGVLSLSNIDKRHLNDIFRSRYRPFQDYTELLKEQDWLASLQAELLKEKHNHQGKVSGIILGALESTINEIIESMNNQTRLIAQKTESSSSI